MPSAGAALESTSGAGFDLETHVGAWVMVHMLRGLPVFGSSEPPTRVSFQMKNAGWGQVDDLVVWFGVEAESPRLALSIKKKDVLRSGWQGSELTEVVDAAVGFTSTPGEVRFRSDRDRVGLVGQDVTPPRLEEARRVLERARAMEPERFAAEHETSRALNDESRAFIDAVRGRLRDGAGWTSIVGVLRCLHLESSSLLRRGSDDDNRAVDWCQRLTAAHTRESGRQLWIVLLEEASRLRRTGGGGNVDTDELVRRVRGRVPLASVLDHDPAWAWLDRRTASWLRSTKSTLPDGRKVPRAHVMAALRDGLASRRVVVLEGESGVGKSALVKELLEALALPQVVVLDPFSLQDVAEARRAWPANLDLPEVLGASRVARQLLVLDSAESFDENGWRLIREDIGELMRRQQDWCVVLTARPGMVDEELARLGDVLGIEATGRFTVPLLGADELSDLLGSGNRPALRHLPRGQTHPVLGNLKKLSLLLGSEALRADGVIGDSDVIDAFVKGSEAVRRRRRQLTHWAGRLADEHRDAGASTELEEGVRKELVAAGVVWDDCGRLRFTHDLHGDWCRALLLLDELDLGRAEQLVSRVGNPRWDRALRVVSTVLLERERWSAWRGLWRQASAEPRLRQLVLDGLLLAARPVARFAEGLGPVVKHDPAVVAVLLERLLATCTQPTELARKLAASLDPVGAAVVLRGGVLSEPVESAWVPCIGFVLAAEGSLPTGVLLPLSKVVMVWLAEAARPHAHALAHRFLGEAVALTAPDREPRLVGHAWKELYLAGLLSARTLEEPGRALVRCWAGLGERTRPREEDGDGGPSSGAAQDQSPASVDLPATAWERAPSRRLDPTFAEAVHDPRGAQALSQIDPELLEDVLLATLLEPPREYERHGPSLGEDVGLCEPPSLPLLPQCFPPLALLLAQAPESGLGLVCTVLDHSTLCRWRERQRPSMRRGRVRPRTGHSIDQGPGFCLVVDGEPRWFYGDQLVSLWVLGHGGVVPTILLATVEAWVQADPSRLELTAAYLLEHCRSAAVLGLLVMFARRWPQRLDDALSPLMTSPRLLHGFHGMEGKVLHRFLHGGDSLRKATLAWFDEDLRHRPLQRVVFDEFVARSLNWPTMEVARQGWLAQRDGTDEEWLHLWIDQLSERFDPGRWVREDHPDGPRLVHQPDPATAARSSWAFGPSKTFLQVFTLTQRLREEALPPGIAGAQLAALWDQVASDAVPEGVKAEAWQDKLLELRTAFSAVLLRHHAAWLQEEPERLELVRSWFRAGLLAHVHQRWETRTLIHHAFVGRDLLVGLDGLCRHWWSDHDTRVLLGQCLLRCDVPILKMLTGRLASLLNIEDMGRISHLVAWSARIHRLGTPASFRSGGRFDWTPAADQLCSDFSTGVLQPRFGDWQELTTTWPEEVEEPLWEDERGRPEGLNADLIAASMWWIPWVLGAGPAGSRQRLTRSVQHLMELVLADARRRAPGPSWRPRREPLDVHEPGVAELAGRVALAHPDTRVGIAICRRWLSLEPLAHSYSAHFLLGLYRSASDGDSERAFGEFVTTLFDDALAQGGWGSLPLEAPEADLLVALAGFGRYYPVLDEPWPKSRAALAAALGPHWPTWVQALLDGWVDLMWVARLFREPAFEALDESVLTWLSDELVERMVGRERDRAHLLGLLRIIASRSAPHRSMDGGVRDRFAAVVSALVRTGDRDAAVFAQGLTATE